DGIRDFHVTGVQTCALPILLNIVTGDVRTGELLTTDKRVDMVSFTGSDKVGSLIMAQGAPTLKKMHLELGGKSALIIRGDADLRLEERRVGKEGRSRWWRAR